MIFSSLHFVYLFLPAFLSSYFLSRSKQYSNHIVLLFSLFFYSWGAPSFFISFIVLTIFNYVIAKYIGESQTSWRKVLFVLGIATNITLLCYYKYLNFIIEELNKLLHIWHLHSMQPLNIELPIGVSFIVFECISYLTDVYRNTSKPTNSYVKFSLFISLFPHAIAGPIFRWYDMESQFDGRQYSFSQFNQGCYRFIIGLGKKVILANCLGQFADKIFAIDPSLLPSSYLILGAVAYSLQIYFDFSGYSDMAIGMGKAIGFNFNENFNKPYLSTSVSEFWQRWHISLSAWFKDYVYIPLGGSRVGTIKHIRNLVIVFFLSGLWHGANWTFILWGIYHSILIILEKLLRNDASAKLPTILKIFITFILISVGWIIFRSMSIGHAFRYLTSIWSNVFLVPDGWVFSGGSWFMVEELLSNREMVFFIIGIIVCFILEKKDSNVIINNKSLQAIFAISILLYSTICLLVGGHNPFLYFQF